MGFRDERYLDLAKYFSTWSKDPSRGVGACAIGAHGQVLAQGYNGFPRGVKDDIERYENKDFKYIKSKFTNTEIKYYGLSTLIFFPFYKSPNNSSFFKFLTIFDQYLFKLKFFQWFAWSVLIRAKKS